MPDARGIAVPPTEPICNAIPSRLHTCPEGLFGGEAGASGAFLISGEATLGGQKRAMNASDEILMHTPGGGGYGTPPTA